MVEVLKDASRIQLLTLMTEVWQCQALNDWNLAQILWVLFSKHR